MDEKQFEALVAKVGQEAADKIKSLFDEKKADFASKTDIDEALKSFSIKAEDITIEGKSLVDVLKEQSQAIAKKEATEVATKTIAQQVKDGVSKFKNDWDAMRNKKQPFELQLKDAGTMTTSNVPTAANSFVPSSRLLSGYNPVVSNTPLVLQYANVTNSSEHTIFWVDETTGEGGADWTAEGAAKPLMDVNVTVRNVSATKVAVAFKVSEESLADIPFMSSLIETTGRRDLALKIDDGLINGDGTNDQPYGIGYYAPAFTNIEMNDSIVNPNYFDALGAAATQIRRANFTPTIVFINPVDWFKMMHTKDAEEGYVLLQLQLQNGAFLEMAAVKSNQVTVGEFIMGDMNYFNVAVREAVRLEVGWENDDFRRNLRTIIIEGRLSSFVSENNKLAFCKDTYADVIDAIAVGQI